MNINKSILISLVTFTSILAISCSDRDIPDEWNKTESSGGIEIAYTIDNTEEETRGIPANARESKLEEVYALFFSKEPESALLCYKSVSVRAGSKKLGFEPPAELTPGVNYDVLLIGNGRYFLPDGVTDMSQMLGKLLNSSRGTVEATLSLASNSEITYRYPEVLPMWGRYVSANDNDVERPFNFTVIEENGNKTYITDGEFRFSRTVERIDLVNLVPETLDVKFAKVCNYRTSGLVFVDGFLPADSEVVTLDNENPAPTADAPGDYVAASYGDDGTQQIKESLYAFPNLVQASVQNDRVSTCLIIAGYYTDPSTKVKDTSLTYYRFNLANIGEAQLLKRNYVYTALIKGVKRRGKPTDLEAYNDKAPVFDYDVDDEWDITDDNYVTDGKGNFLICSKTHLTFQGTHSSADKIELKVSTNPELTWTIEPVATAGHSNSLFTCEKFTANSIKAGPLQKNETPYVRFGYFRIVAKNKNSASAPVNLSLNLYLQQLTIDPNFKCLMVDGCTGTLNVELPPTGGVIYLPVATGSDLNSWVATCAGFNPYFGTTSKFETSGGNHGTLMITVEPNLTTGVKNKDIVVSLSPNDPNVLPVTVRLTQARSPQKMVLNPKPTNMNVDIDAFSTAVGNPNGVVNPYRMSVTLMDPINYKFKVESSFDKYRDLRLSLSSPFAGAATHPTAAEEKADSPYNDALLALSNGDVIYFNPFRTGPGDGTITGSIKITAYDVRDPNNTSKQEVQTIQVRITTPEVRIDDVILTADGNQYLFPDRSLGMRPRINDATNRVVAKFYHYYAYVKINHDRGVEIPYYHNTDFNDKPLNDYLGNTDIPGATQYGAWGNGGSFQALMHLYTPTGFAAPALQFLNMHEDASNRYSPFYHPSEAAKWGPPGPAAWTNWGKTNVVFSKWRPFLVSDVKVNIPVCCWIQFPLKGLVKQTGNNQALINSAIGMYMTPYSSSTSIGYGRVNCITHNTMVGTTASPTYSSSFFYAVRPVRTMTAAEVNTYKTYLSKGQNN